MTGTPNTIRKIGDDEAGEHMTPEEAKKILIRRILFQALAFSLTFCNYATLHASRAAWSNATP